MKIINPATEEIITQIEVDSSATILAKFNAAKKAQKEWASTNLESRMEIIRQFKFILQKDMEELSNLLTEEMGKPISQSRNEIKATLTRIDFFLENVSSVLKEEWVFRDSSQMMEEVLRREPLGIIANISAWNYPYFVGSNVFIPALLCGNAVLYKPSEFTSLTGLAIAKRLHQSGIPERVFIPIIGEGQIGAELNSMPVNGVFFTGSYNTGIKVANEVQKKLLKLQLELGGKDPIYVCDDAAVELAAESTADGAFYNNGQSCCSVERIYVHEKIYDPFVERFLKTVRAFKMGSPKEESTYLGPLTRKSQIVYLQQQIQDAIEKGATLLTGGKPVSDRKGYYFEPTVLTHTNHKMEIMREESFGPVIGIQKVKDDAEAISLMNDSCFGLTAGVYSQNRSRAEKILNQINSGSVYWNCCDRVSPRLPWSGRGHSGLGLTLSKEGILCFTQPKGYHLKTI